MIKKSIGKIIKNGSKYFLVSFSKRVIKKIENKNNIKGILFPEIIIAEKKKINKTGIKNFKIFLLFILKNTGIKKKENIENLWIYPPATSSSPKGPENLAPNGLYPKISWPKFNW